MPNEKKEKVKTLRHMEYYDMVDRFDELYSRSQSGEHFKNLMGIISSEENIKLAYRNIKRNSGSLTAGTDKKTIRDLEGLTQEEYVAKVKNKLKWYKPKPVRRVEIPKPGSDKKRPLGIPCIWDRIVQQCILQVLEPICEAKFSNNSYGFRPNRSAENAIAVCAFNIQHRELSYVVDIDIKGFFDNVCHTKLIRQIWAMGIRDCKLISIIKEMLKAPIKMPTGETIIPEKGTPQGGILSPLLSNIVLNELDWWVASQWETFPTRHEYVSNYKSRPNNHNYKNKNRALRTTKLKEIYMVRYADDFKIFCRNYDTAKKTFIAVKNWLKERLKLEISEEKSKIIDLRKRYSNYLGFKIKAKKKRKKYVAISHINDKALVKIRDKLNNQIERIAHPQNEKDRYRQASKYNSMVIGIHNYYCIATRVSEDLGKVGYYINRRMENRIQKDYQRVPSNWSMAKHSMLWKRYHESKMIRMIGKTIIVPIGYAKTKNAMNKKSIINKYTKEGREEIHKLIRLDMSKVLALMYHPEIGTSIEYTDNRISLYCAQYGKCYVCGRELELEDIHCHHKIRKKDGGTDKYNNLVILHKDIHILVHATEADTIMKYLKKLNLNQHQLDKLNRLRSKLQLSEITREESI